MIHRSPSPTTVSTLRWWLLANAALFVPFVACEAPPAPPAPGTATRMEARATATTSATPAPPAMPSDGGASSSAEGDAIYDTHGTHNPPSDFDGGSCSFPHCVYTRGKDEPKDPRYPDYWTSHWNMYRVFNQFREYPPPYDKAPPPPLKENVDYERSAGITSYDWTWKGPGGVGAMKEHYEKRCLPIFPFANNYTCSFISLGDIAFFVTYDADRPAGMPPVCLFSPKNHPPEPTFINHLPYARTDGEHLKTKVQGYSFWVPMGPGQPVQRGVSPDRTNDGLILFGYAYEATPRPDSADHDAGPYQHPQSFYFSGVPYMPEVPLPNAPIVSQNYTDFAMIKPDASTWAEVATLDPTKLPKCHLFPEDDTSTDAGAPPPPGSGTLMAEKLRRKAPSWSKIGKQR
jgi:hypothetical protein